MIFSRKFILVQIIFSAVIILWFGFRMINTHPAKPLPVIGRVADFSLLDATHQPFGLSDLRGKVWVVDFIFTTCGSICPIMTQHMQFLYKNFLMFNDVHFVSISVNPDNDTPAVLHQFAMKYKADPKHWSFLTGTRDEITRLAVGSFKLGDMKEPIFHSPHFVLVDRQGQIRGYYEGTDKNNLTRISQDIRRVLLEK